MSGVKQLPFTLPPPEGGRPDLLVIAGEHSGDQHAALAVRELRIQRPDLRVCALGGPALAAAGAQVLHDLTATSVVGFVEVLKHFSFFRALLNDTVRWIAEHRPRAVCLVDYPGFNLRLAQRLKARGLSRMGGGETPVLYYISPQIWAWKAGRRFAMAETLDALAVIFPFELQSYADTKLSVKFVGHPFLVDRTESFVRYDPAGPVLLLPGSRKQAVARIFPALLAGYERYRREGGDREAVVIHPGAEVLDVLRRWPEPAHRLVPAGEPVAAAAVLTSSGTMSLRCALAGIPGAVTYRANPVSYWIGRQVVRVPYIGIANLLLGEPLYPEFIQGAATPANFADQLHVCLGDPRRAERTQAQAARLRTLLGEPADGSVGQWLGRCLASTGGA